MEEVIVPCLYPDEYIPCRLQRPGTLRKGIKGIEQTFDVGIPGFMIRWRWVSAPKVDARIGVAVADAPYDYCRCAIQNATLLTMDLVSTPNDVEEELATIEMLVRWAFGASSECTVMIEVASPTRPFWLS